MLITRITKILLICIISLLLFTTSLANAGTLVTSREYKLILVPNNFNGTNPDDAVNDYWSELKMLVEAEPININMKGSLTLSKNRTVKFYDTPGTCQLRKKDLVFRERVENENREVVLKFRSPDRYIASSLPINSDDTKFEEDISKPFCSKFSYSAGKTITANQNLSKIDNIMSLYPELEKYQFALDEPIKEVNGLTISEKVYKGGKVDLGNKKSKFSLTLWYDSPSSTEPKIAEISFTYKDSEEDYSGEIASRAKQVFEAMQGMSNWVSEKSPTKTSFVYEYGTVPFCNKN
ncbi:MAG: hypothetical protein QNJ33_18535 [Crocosphaera sp.]|nr:hypothetical protein [Crocosphaera sp.]